MTTLVHLSDLHFGRIDPAVAAALLHDLNRDPPDLVVVSGDLTQQGRRREFEAAAAFLAALECPSLVVAGNHDLPERHLPLRFLAPTRRFEAAIGPIEPRLETPALALAGLHTPRPWAWELDWSHGQLAPAQLDSVTRFLAGQPPARLRVVVAHHPFLIPPGETRRRLVGGAGPALASLAEAGTELLLTGHLHRTYHTRTLVPTAAGLRPMLVLQAATATSTRRRDEANGFHHLRWDPVPRTLTVTTHAWSGQHFIPLPATRYSLRAERAAVCPPPA